MREIFIRFYNHNRKPNKLLISRNSKLFFVDVGCLFQTLKAFNPEKNKRYKTRRLGKPHCQDFCFTKIEANGHGTLHHNENPLLQDRLRFRYSNPIFGYV